MLTAMKIHGAIDAEGRCRHWHSPLDVVANKCATCGEYFACALCHAELTDHEFGPMLADAPFAPAAPAAKRSAGKPTLTSLPSISRATRVRLA